MLDKLIPTLALLLALAPAQEPIDLGTRLELFVDDHLIESLAGADLVLHRLSDSRAVVLHPSPTARPKW